MKYRVIKLSNLYYPQKKRTFLGWSYFYDNCGRKVSFGECSFAIGFVDGERKAKEEPEVCWSN